MSSNHNSITPRFNVALKDLAEAVGVTQFPSETGWYQIVGGLIVQGGFVEISSGTTVTVPLYAPYEKQFLGVWLQTQGGPHNSAHVDGETLTQFEITSGAGNRGYYWLSIGV